VFTGYAFNTNPAPSTTLQLQRSNPTCGKKGKKMRATQKDGEKFYYSLLHFFAPIFLPFKP